MIDKNILLQIADLSKLNISEEQLSEYMRDLNGLMEPLEKIQEVKTDNVDITYNVNNMKNPLGDDEVRESLPQEEVLKNTVEEQYGYFKILRVMD